MWRSLVLIMGVALVAPAAFAQDDAEPVEEVSSADLARNAFNGGRTQYNLGHFNEALTLFAKAYELNPAPLLLFNLGQCHRQLKNHERAIFFFDGYLREDPTTTDRDLVLGLIEEEKGFLAEAKAEAAMAATEAEALRAANAEPPPEIAPEPEPEAEAEGAWVPWAIGGGAVVVAAAAGVTVAMIALNSPQGRQGLAPPTLGELDLR